MVKKALLVASACCATSVVDKAACEILSGMIAHVLYMLANFPGRKYVALHDRGELFEFGREGLGTEYVR